MGIPHTLSIKDRSLDVHLGGPGFGEGVFIVIGKTIGIGIDCCSSFIAPYRGTKSFLEQKIEELPSEGVVLWILTHYHYDHYHCLSSVLKRFSDRIKGTIFPLDYNPADMSYLADQIHEFPDSPSKVYRAKKEYSDLRSLLKLEPFRFNVARIQGTQQWLSNQLALPNNDVIALSVKICSAASDIYDKQFGMSLSELRDRGSSTTRAHANRGSYIIHFGLGEFEGLFLGDAGSERIEQLVKNEFVGPHGIDCLKVGHHGSSDATSNELLDLCARVKGNTKKQHALIAPYKAAGLPSNEVIDMLEAFGYTVHISGGRKEAAKVRESIRSEGMFLVDVAEAVAAGSDIVSLKFRF